MDRPEELESLKERIYRVRTVIQELRRANRELSTRLREAQRAPDTQALDEVGSDAGHRKRVSEKRTGPSAASARDLLLESRLELLLRERKEVRDKIEKLLQRLEGV